MGVATTARSSNRPLPIPRLRFRIEQVLPCFLFTPLHAYYALQHDSLATLNTLLACALENAVVFHIFLALALSLPPPELLFFRKQRLKQRRLLVSLLSLAFLHAFMVAAQITAVALMRTKMNADFIFNLVRAVHTSAWSQTDAKHFFPLSLLLTLAVELAWVSWAYFRSEARRHAHAKKHSNAASIYIKTYMHGEPSSSQIKVKRSLLTLTCLLLFIRPLFLRRGYAPIGNTLVSLAEYSSQFRQKTNGGHSIHRRRYLNERGGARKNALRYFNYRKTLPRLDETSQTNVVVILNESLGNCMLHTKEGREAFPFFSHLVQQHPSFFPFLNARTTSANTRTAATAALTGYSVIAQDDDAEAWSYFDLPSLFTLAEAMGYRLVLFSPYDSEKWWPYHEIFDERFHQIVSRSTLKAKAANDMGMDDRVLTQKVVQFLEEQGREGGGDGRPFVCVVLWNNLHTPFLLNERSKFLKEQLVEGGEEGRAGVKEKEKAEGGIDGEGEESVGAECDVMQEGEGDDRGEGESDQAACDATPALTVRAAPPPSNSSSQPFLPAHLVPLPSGRPLEKYQLYKFKRAMGALEISQDMMTSVYDTLQVTGLLNNTLISFQADHGEGLLRASKRLADPDSFYLSVPFWLHVPPGMMVGMEGEARRAALQGNRDRLVSNLDMVPTLIELLGWDTAEHLFANVPPIFQHGASLLQPLAPDRITAGWQGRPFVESCDWQFGFLSNATHNVILRNERNDVVVEEIDALDATRAKVARRWALRELPASEQAFWVEELRRRHRPMLEAFQACFFDYVTLD